MRIFNVKEIHIDSTVSKILHYRQTHILLLLYKEFSYSKLVLFVTCSIMSLALLLERKMATSKKLNKISFYENAVLGN